MSDKYLDKQNSKFHNFTEWVYRLLYINVLWIFFTALGIVVVGLFPATYAVFELIKRFKNGDDFNIFNSFKEFYLKNIKKANKIGYINLIIGAFLVFDMIYFYSNAESIINIILFSLIIFLSFFMVLITIYIPIVYVYFPKLGVKDTYKFSFLLSIGLPKHTALLIITTFLSYLFFSTFLSTVYFISISLPAYIFVFIVDKKFKALMEAKRKSNLNYVELDKYQTLDEIYKLWNIEYSKYYRITDELFNQYTFHNKGINRECSFVATSDKDELVGFILIETSDKEEYLNNAWIQLIYVSPLYRKIGVGTKLVKLATEKLNEMNRKELQLGAGFQTYFPGLPSEFTSHQVFFSKNGFDYKGSAYDFIGTFTNIKSLAYPHLKTKYASNEDKEVFSTFLKENFSIRWFYEWNSYLEKKSKNEGFKEYLLLLDEGTIIGFVRISYDDSKQITHSMNWKHQYKKRIGGIGPLGIAESERKKGYGTEIVNVGINTLIHNGVNTIRIDWTGHINFYSQLGFEIEKTYLSYKKSI